MPTDALQTVVKRLADQFAEEIGYSAASAGIYRKAREFSAEWFYYQSGPNRGVFEFTPCVGVDIPSVNTLAALVPGLERGAFPTMGGPLFRFADLTEAKLHDFIIKLSSEDDHGRCLSQLRQVWRQVAKPFLARCSAAAGWVAEAERFINTGKIGALSVPIAGRTSVVLLLGARGADAARQGLGRLAELGPERRPFQDYEQARRLFDLVIERPALLDELRQALKRQ